MYDKDSRNVILLAGIGAILEFYDFVLYMIFSKEISATFFAQITNPTIKTFLTVLIFSIAYLVRPFAGTILGIVGDLIGRRRLLLFTILLMGSCSLCMGLMPGYAQWGLYASFVFVLLRIMQGIALGGELPGAYVIVYESVKGKIGFATAILFTFVTGGFLFSDFVVCALPVFYLMSYIGSVSAIVFASIAIMLCYSLVAATFIFLLCDLFPTDVRLSGVGLSYNLAFAIVGGIAPLVSTTIITMTAYNFLGPSIVGIVCGVIGLLGVYVYSKRGGYHKNNKDMIVKL